MNEDEFEGEYEVCEGERCPVPLTFVERPRGDCVGAGVIRARGEAEGLGEFSGEGVD